MFSCKTIIIAVFGVDFFVEYVGNGTFDKSALAVVELIDCQV